jgi:hypothetical protein
MLKPTEKRIVSVLSNFNFNKRRTTKPGTKVRYKKPIICLATGILKIVVKQNAVCAIKSVPTNGAGFRALAIVSFIMFAFPAIARALKKSEEVVE